MVFGDEHLHPLGFLIGTWRGEGVGAQPDGDGPDFPYAEMLRIYDDGSPWLAYSTQVVSAEDGHWIHSESGWWRDQPTLEDGSIPVELVISRAGGVVEVLVGQVTQGPAGDQVELISDVVARTPTARAVSADRRLYAVRGGKLLYAIDSSIDQSGLAPHLAAALDRIDDPD
ncbi:MAG TPA: FABP family protein [Mycobacteriales bacterium]|nr:FABP family protein [Mycobacteriales bacterium]